MNNVSNWFISNMVLSLIKIVCCVFTSINNFQTTLLDFFDTFWLNLGFNFIYSSYINFNLKERKWCWLPYCKSQLKSSVKISFKKQLSISNIYKKYKLWNKYLIIPYKTIYYSISTKIFDFFLTLSRVFNMAERLFGRSIRAHANSYRRPF